MSDVAVVLSIDLTWHTKEEGEGGEGRMGGHGTSSGSIDTRTMSAIILRGSFSTEEFGRAKMPRLS